MFLYFHDAPQSRDVVSDHDNGQVIAPFLITLQVANRRESTGDVVSGSIGPLPSSRGESTGDGGTPTSERSTSTMGMGGKSPSGLGVRVVTTIDLHRDKL